MSAQQLLRDTAEELLSASATGEKAVTLNSLCGSIISDYVRAKEEGSIGYPSKWHPVDRMLASYAPGMCYVMAGEPSNGKTTMAFNEVEHTAEVTGVPCAIIAIDTGNKQLAGGLLAYRAKLSQHKLRQGDFSDDDLAKLHQAKKELDALPIYIYDKSGDWSDVCAFMSTVVSRYGVRFIVIDYVQLLTIRRWREGKEQEMAEIASRIKAFGKKHDCVMMVLSQLRRRGHVDGTKTPPRPTLETLKYSSGIEQVADVVMAISKEPGHDLGDFLTREDWPMSWEVLKNRFGPTGLVGMMFQRGLQTFSTQEQYEIDIKRQNNTWFESRNENVQTQSGEIENFDPLTDDF